jgi:isopropylmalate/homocitrate/citramalate synthase
MNTFTPDAVGNERRILVSEVSGRSNIVAKTTKFNISQDNELMSKDSECCSGSGERRVSIRSG